MERKAANSYKSPLSGTTIKTISRKLHEDHHEFDKSQKLQSHKESQIPTPQNPTRKQKTSVTKLKSYGSMDIRCSVTV